MGGEEVRWKTVRTYGKILATPLYCYGNLLNCVTKIIPTCSPVIGQFFDTMTVASIDEE